MQSGVSQTAGGTRVRCLYGRHWMMAETNELEGRPVRVTIERPNCGEFNPFVAPLPGWKWTCGPAGCLWYCAHDDDYLPSPNEESAERSSYVVSHPVPLYLFQPRLLDARPTKSEPLAGIFAKTKRTVTQINDLDARIGRFFGERPYEVAANLNADGTKLTWYFRLTRQLPDDIPVIVGEILHNLRSPLDQILGAVAIKHGLREEGIAFPRGRSPEEFETALRKQEKLLPADATELIRATQPYPGGNNLLWALLELNRRDKHRVGIIPIALPAEIKASYLCFWRGLGLTIGRQGGISLVMEKPLPNSLEETGWPHALYDARPGHLIFGNAGDPGDPSLEFMTTTPRAKFDTDFQPALNIAFGEVGVDGQPLVSCLDQMRELVEGILLTFEARFWA